MKVIFIKDLRNQGKKGEIKEVKDGYAKNFLIKNGYAVKETKETLTKLKRDNQKQEEEIKENIKKAEKLKKELEAKTYKFKVKTGKNDKVFGSISAKQIKDEIGDLIDKKQIIINYPIQSLGFHNVEINLYKDVKATIKIEVTK
ncbi:MAG: 50S ribosomal protein L9 [bacterium]|nr:50S ribosomal protein L9 [bacterium]